MVSNMGDEYSGFEDDNDDQVCPNCGDSGVGLLGVHEVLVGYEYLDHPDTPNQPFPWPIYQDQEEYGSPCPTCDKEALAKEEA